MRSAALSPSAAIGACVALVALNHGRRRMVDVAAKSHAASYLRVLLLTLWPAQPASCALLSCLNDRHAYGHAFLQAGALGAAATAALRGASAAHYATTSGDELASFVEHTTGPEREELEAKAKGIENPWHEAWCANSWYLASALAVRGSKRCRVWMCAGAAPLVDRDPARQAKIYGIATRAADAAAHHDIARTLLAGVLVAPLASHALHPAGRAGLQAAFQQRHLQSAAGTVTSLQLAAANGRAVSAQPSTSAFWVPRAAISRRNPFCHLG